MNKLLTIRELVTRITKDLSFERNQFATIYIDEKQVSYKEFEHWLNKKSEDKAIQLFCTDRNDFLFIETNIIKYNKDSEELLQLF